jgi:hypothetical protein
MKAALKILFSSVPGALILAFAFTIIGSFTNHDGLLGAGVIAWLAGSFMFFAWLVILMWARRKKYGR